MRKLYFQIAFVFSTFNFAQQSMSAVGGNAIDANYHLTFNVGQIDYVSAKDSNSSLNQGVLQIYYNTALSTNELSLETKIYPNPVSEFLFVELNPYKKDTPYQIFDAQGRMIKSGKISSEKNQIDLGEYSQGIYILKIATEKSIKTYKLIKK